MSPTEQAPPPTAAPARPPRKRTSETRPALDPMSLALGNVQARLEVVERGQDEQKKEFSERLRAVELHLTAQDHTNRELQEKLDNSLRKMEERAGTLETKMTEGFGAIATQLATLTKPLAYVAELMARDERLVRKLAARRRSRRYAVPRLEYVAIAAALVFVAAWAKSIFDVPEPVWLLPTLTLIALLVALALIGLAARVKGEEQDEQPDVEESGQHTAHTQAGTPSGVP